MAATHDLPLAWTRLIGLNLLCALSILSSALSIKLFTRHAHDQNDINKSVPQGTSVRFHYTEILSTTILLYLAGMFSTMLSSHIAIALVQDMWNIIPMFIQRRMNIASKRLSTSTLGHQVWLLSLSFVFQVIDVSFMTHYVYTGTMGVIVNGGRDPESTVQPIMESLGISTSYAHTPYVRDVPLASWPAVGFGLISAIVTFIAWRRSIRYGSQVSGEVLMDGERKGGDTGGSGPTTQV